MDPHFDPVIRIFRELLELAPAERVAHLDRACGDEPGLRERVERLIRAHESAGGFLDEPVLFVHAGIPASGAIGEKAGDRVGKYQLLQQIGEGGCGVVFLAGQQEPVQRQVALKVVKPGMDSRRVIAQFESERQALAMMEHPHIAQVLDAGATAAGRPYFVMELVRGTKITEYCDRHSLTIPARLELFVQVCHAIQHAHQKGIIHRDIKPSNILVSTTSEGSPLPKVIDFGIAKATTGQQLTDKTFFTAVEMLIGTPAYMSPEQAALKGSDLDTRTDIYSLGVLLYELLAGTTPTELRDLQEVGLDELRRDIQNKQAIRPSSRLKAMDAAALGAVSHRRQADPSRLIRAVRGDLDWIVMKALEKEPSRRYPTANALAVDVQHHLADEPVNARPPSTLYQLRKLVARNRLLVGGLAVIALLLVGSTAVMSTLFAKEQAAHRQAESEKRTAEVEAAKSRQVTKVMTDMLEGVSPSVAMGRDTTMLREILDKTDQRITDNLGDQPEAAADLRISLGLGYRELGENEQAEKMLSRAVDYYRSQSPAKDRDLAVILNRLIYVQLKQERIEDAETNLAEVLELWRKLGEEDAREGIDAQELLSMLRWRQKRLDEAEELMLRIYDWRRKHLPAEDPDTTKAQSNLAGILYAGKRYPEAEQLFRQSLAASERFYGKDHPEMALLLENLGVISAVMGKTAEAKGFHERAVAIRREFNAPDHPHRISAVVKLADLDASSGYTAEAESLYRELIASGRKDPDDYGSVLHVLQKLFTNLRKWGRPADADAVFAEILTPEYCRTAKCVPVLKLRAELLGRVGRWHDAAIDAARLVELQPEEHEHYHTLAPLLVAEGRVEDYRQLCAKIIQRFHTPTDIFMADRMAKDCLIQPSALPDLERVSLIANAVLRQGDGYGSQPFFQVLKALSDYRLGKLPDAAAGGARVDDSIVHAKVIALAIQAMAASRMDQSDQAREFYAQANAIFESKLPKRDSGELGQDWRDWIIARELLTEARALLDPAGGQVTGNRDPE